jgi:hypothetical protein
MGRTVDENVKTAAGALKSAAPSGPRFDSWYNTRREEGSGVIVMLRERAMQLTEPIEAAFGLGKELLSAASPSPAAPRVHRRRRRAAHR